MSEIDGVLCDIDDTLTHNGRIIPGVIPALQRAQELGLAVVPVTGRPGGWVDHIARVWPVDGVVGENGGLWFWMDDTKLQRRFAQSVQERQDNRMRLDALAARILENVKGTALASDQSYRDLDLAIDFCEDVPPLCDEDVDRIVAYFESEGATCKVSSIHVNGWFGSFDKLSGIKAFHRERWGCSINPDRWVFFGDSANDEPMFEAFSLSVGVANVRRFLPRLTHPPKWITSKAGGEGFIEGLDHIIATMGV